MSQLVPRESIELIVGVPRHATEHWAKSVSAEYTVYILHSQACLDRGIDLRGCDFSVALDGGIHVPDWPEDVPLHVVVDDDFHLVPLVEDSDEHDEACSITECIGIVADVRTAVISGDSLATETETPE